MSSEKKYAVIICRNCHYPKITETKQKTTKCPRCGKSLTLSKTKTYYETNYLSKARQVIGQINAEQDDRLDEFKNFLKQSH